MKRAAQKLEDVLGTRIELLQTRGEGERIKSALLLLAEARTKKDSADQVIGAIQRGVHVDQETHEEAEEYYYDGVMRAYLYATQELAWPGSTKDAPATENDDDATEESRNPAAAGPTLFQGGGNYGNSGNYGNYGPQGGFNLGGFFAMDMLANLVGDMLGGFFGGGGGWGNGGW